MQGLQIRRRKEGERLMNDEMLVLCNRWNPIPQDYRVEEAVSADGVPMDGRILAACGAFMAEIAAQGLRAQITSAYRSWQEQEEIMQYWIGVHRAEGLSAEEAVARAELRVAIPGTSEHQLGLALDIEPVDGDDDPQGLYPWMAENAHRFGFILRYPAEKTPVTGIGYEPWHFRYVGLRPAREMYQQGLCLEEYLQK